jgi:hypothetical protein
MPPCCRRPVGSSSSACSPCGSAPAREPPNASPWDWLRRCSRSFLVALIVSSGLFTLVAPAAPRWSAMGTPRWARHSRSEIPPRDAGAVATAPPQPGCVLRIEAGGGNGDWLAELVRACPRRNAARCGTVADHALTTGTGTPARHGRREGGTGRASPLSDRPHTPLTTTSSNQTRLVVFARRRCCAGRRSR